MTDALYKNLRNETDQKRVYLLTRSTFAGQQRAAATTWSGDIGANWDVYRKQISAGINHCMAGIPYWTFDIGAFVIGSYAGRLLLQRRQRPGVSGALRPHVPVRRLLPHLPFARLGDPA